MFFCLKAKAESTACSKCARRAAYQLAFCYFVGLGTSRDSLLAQIWAKIDRKSLEDLEDELDGVVDFCIWRNKKVTELQLSGFTMAMDHVNEYRGPNYNLEEVAGVYRREVQDLGESLSDQPLITVTLKTILADILRDSGEFSESEDIYKSLLLFFENNVEFGPDGVHREWSLSIRCRLAEIARARGDLGQAESLILYAMEARDKILTHLDMECHTTLGSIWYDMERWDKAAAKFQEVVTTATTVLGPDSQLRLHAVSNLASAYRALGDLDKAEKLDVKALQSKQQILDSRDYKHHSTVTSMANLTLTYTAQEKYDEAESLEEKVVQRRIEEVGPLHPSTLIAKKNLGITKRHKGNFREAADLLKVVVDGQEKVLGRTHPQALDSLLILVNTLTMAGYKQEYGSVLRSLPQVELHSDHPMVKRYMQGYKKLVTDACHSNDRTVT